MHYVIGDVHGHYNTLIALIEKLPKDAKLIFVGDLVDRGEQSADVVRFVRENNHLCVMGNHEELMLTYGDVFISSYCQEQPLSQHNIWYSNGGINTLLSYGVISLKDGKLQKVPSPEKQLLVLRDDLKWMQALPLYIELDIEHVSCKPVVVSHAPITTVWGMRQVDSLFSTFCRMATTNRRDPDEDAKIFNIFGHTPMSGGVKVRPHFVNVDTGCYVSKDGYNRLSAYCIETGETVSVAYVK